MDAVLNKLKNKVSTVLPGNPLTREYEIGKLLGCAGPGMLWKLYAAKKRSTQQEATVWALEKKNLESYPKSQKETVLDVMKYGVASMTRIKHPKILSVVQPLEESRDSLAFASEPLFTSLRNALCPSYSSVETSSEALRDFTLTDIEIKYGLIQLTEALHFLHSDCHRLHLNLVPEAVVINKYGLWKLAGFEFSKLSEDSCNGTNGNNQNQNNSSLETVISVPIWQTALMPACQPALHACSPESILQGKVSRASDMFSLGLLICCLYNKGQPLLDTGNDYSAYRRGIKDVASTSFSKLTVIPEQLREYVKMMLSSDPDIRPDALQFSRIPYFEDGSMSVLRSIDNMYQLDNLARSQFYKSLPSTIHLLPKRLCLYRVFPQITEDFSNPHMVPFVLPPVLQIMDMVSQTEFIQYMMARVIPVLALKEPIQITLVLLQNLRVLTEKFPTSEFRTHVLPMLHSALDTDNRTIQELCLRALPSISQMMELTTLRNAVLPRIQKLFFRTDLLTTRISCLICLGKLLDHLDKWIVMDEIVPFLQQIKSREPSILMAILGIYRLALSHEKLGISRDKLATRILPHVIPLSVEGTLNLKQYNAYAHLIRDMCAQLEREQRAKLEQMHGAAEEPNMIGVDAEIDGDLVGGNSCAQVMDHVMRVYVDSSLGLTVDNSVSKTVTVPSSGVAQGQNLLEDATPEKLTVKTAGLTLEQKRQLAAEQNQRSRLQTQHSLTPLSEIQQPNLAVTSSKPVPRDLTSTLMDSNLNAMTQRPTMTNTSNWSPVAAGSQPWMPAALPRPSINPSGFLTLPQKHSSPYQNGTNSNMQSYSFGNWNMMTRVDGGGGSGSAVGTFGSTQPTHSVVPSPSLFSAATSSQNNGSLSLSSSSSFKPLSKNEIDDLLR